MTEPSSRARSAAATLPLVVAITLTACGGDRGNPGLVVEPITGTTGTAAPTGTTSMTAATGPSTGPTATTGPVTDLEDGRHFGFIETIDASGALAFDLAYFYTGAEANEQAAARGDETPVPNDYYVVNDNPRLRDLQLAPDASISVFDWNHCCDERVLIDVTTFAEVMASPDGFVEVDGALYYGTLSPYWLTVEGGLVTAIEEQYLP